MQAQKVDEGSFYDMHESLKMNKHIIWRVVETSDKGKKYFTIYYT